VILSNYIIRIYRRDKNDPRLIVGIVEKVGTKEKKGFTSFDELREILVPAARRAYRRKAGTYKNRAERDRG
jgi:hypothetical protein